LTILVSFLTFLTGISLFIGDLPGFLRGSRGINPGIFLRNRRN